MGLFDWVDDILLGPVTLMTGGHVNVGSINSMLEGDHETPTIEAPGEDEKTTYLKSLQKRVAKDFRDNLDKNITEGSGLIRAQGEQELDKRFKTVDRNANSRGLLYSGKRQAGREAEAADVAGAIGRKAGEFEQQQRDLARDLDSDVIQSDIQGAYNASAMKGLTNDQYAKKLSKELARKRENQAGITQLGDSISSLAGGFAGGGL